MKNWYVAITLFLTLLIMMGVACSSGDREEEAQGSRARSTDGGDRADGSASSGDSIRTNTRRRSKW